MSTTIKHPLEPLTAQEVQLAVTVLKDAGKVTPTTRFVSVSLKEPDKAFVHAFNPSPPTPLPQGARGEIVREAFAVLFDNATNSCYETAVSLTERKLLSWTHIPGVQPTMTMDEQTECEQAVLASPEFKAALKKHYGITDTKLVMVDIWSAGHYGTEEDRTRRLARPLCFLRMDPTDNGYAKPIEGLRPVVDLNAMKVIRVEEYGHWPLPPQQANYAADRVTKTRSDIKPLEIAQPQGPSFEVDGYQVRWQKWSFVIGFNAREGLTLNHLCYLDNGRERLPPSRGMRLGRSLALPRTETSGRSSIAAPFPRWSSPTAIPRRSKRARTPSMPASTASAIAPTAWSWAAIAWASSSILTVISARVAASR